MLSVSLLFVSISPARADEPTSRQAEAPRSDADATRLLARMQDAFARLVRRVGPSVVAIEAARGAAGLGDSSDPAARPWLSTGSGVILRADGRILTSQHVIDGAVAINVILHDGRRVGARRIAADRRSDLAVIRISVDNLQPAELGDVREVRRGHLVLALGNPLGLSSDGQAAVSHGLVSAIGRPLPETFGHGEDRYYGNMIQTTAPINPGNSGGPLVDIRGRVIGVIAAVSARADGREGMGFAVPIDGHTKAIIDKLLRGQQVEYGYLGVSVDRVDETRRRAAGLAPGRGVVLASVFPRGPADRAGLRDGDVVVSVDDVSVNSVEQFVRTIGAAGPDREVKLDYVRNGVRHVARAVLIRRPSNRAQALPDVMVSFRGCGLGALPAAMRSMANLPGSALLVLRVDADSQAERAGLTPGDVIVRIEGKPVSKETMALLSEADRDLLLGLANGGSVVVKAGGAD